MNSRVWGITALLCLAVLGIPGTGVAPAASQAPPSLGAEDAGDDLAAKATERLQAASADAGSRLAVISADDWQLRNASAAGADLVVCLDIDASVLAEDGWWGIEAVQDSIQRLLAGLAWRSLSVQAWDLVAGRCRPLSDFAPREVIEDEVAASAQAVRRAVVTDSGTVGSTSAAGAATSLVGKTVYVSAGHGWFWNGSQWRTQRPVYQGFIEDHNNAEVVTQFLIPYLENAGATVVPVRERDWATSAAIVDNDRGLPVFSKTGLWFTGGSGSGYLEGTYQYALSTPGEPNAVATWTLDVSEPGEYAVYVWVFPGSNRVPDAHYTVNHAGGSTLVILDQRVFPNTWRYLGTFPFHAGTATISLDNRTESGGSYAVIADAARIGGGTFGSFEGIPALTTLPVDSDSPTPLPGAAPMKPWWEASAFYWTQWSGLDPYDWSYYNDVVARPIFARWHQRSNVGDAVYISWHTNGYNGNNTTVRGTVSYVHNGDTYPRTDGSLQLQAAVHDELVHDIRVGWDGDWTDRGKGQLNLGELRMLWDPTVPSARIPGVLLEIAYHDNYEDGLALKDPGFNQLAARAVYQGIVTYFEAVDRRDLTLLPEPPTHLRVLNAGEGALSVAWQASPTDAQSLGGEAATGYLVYVSSDGQAWGPPQVVVGTHIALSGYDLGDTVYVKVTATNEGGESFPTEVLGARVGEARLMIVSGFDKLNRFSLVSENDPVEHENLRMWLDQMNSRDYAVHHGDATGPIAWDSASNEAVAQSLVSLAPYDIVDWMLGEETTSVDGTLNPAERAVLNTYLSLDRGLLISGSDLGWDLVDRGSAPSFLRETLHTDYVADDAGTYAVSVAGDGAFSGLGDLSFDAPQEYTADFPDVLAPLSGARTSMRYVGGEANGQGAAVEYAAGCRRILVLGFPIETLRAEMRAGVMNKALTFLGACAQTDTAIGYPQDGAAYWEVPQASGTAAGVELAKVWLQLTREGDSSENGAYWAGGAWVPAETWFPAVGTTTWLYAVPALEEGSYHLQAYAEGLQIDTTPASSAFQIDRTSPLTPTVITPTDGITVTGPVVELDWASPPDSGSAVGFELDIDGQAVVTADSPYRVSPIPRPGSHRWRVRAVDGAGNASEWTDWADFEVDVLQTFLPLILRH